MQVEQYNPVSDSLKTRWVEPREIRDMGLADLAQQLETRQDEFWSTALPAARKLLCELHLWIASATPAQVTADIVLARSKFAQFELELRHHLSTEEAILYPLCGYLGQTGQVSSATSGLLKSILQEHQRISGLLRLTLSQLHLMPAPAEYMAAWIELLDALNFMSLVWAEHCERQENEVIPRLEAVRRERAVAQQASWSGIVTSGNAVASPIFGDVK